MAGRVVESEWKGLAETDELQPILPFSPRPYTPISLNPFGGALDPLAHEGSR